MLQDHDSVKIHHYDTIICAQMLLPLFETNQRLPLLNNSSHWLGKYVTLGLQHVAGYGLIGNSSLWLNSAAEARLQ